MLRILSYFLVPVLLLSAMPKEGYATHNRAGEITYEHVSGLTYRFTVITCTKSSAPADRPSLEIHWGDGDIDSLPRTNIQTISGYDAQINTYKGTHTYPGPQTYTAWIEDPNRNSGVVNIPTSVSKSFCIRTQLSISPFSSGPNNSVKFTKRACNELACLGKTYRHNVGAYDPDGDSLAYELIECRGNNCDPIPNYGYPDQCGNCQPGPNNNMSIDPVTGDLTWDAPQKQGEYNVAVKVKEYEDGQLRGWVVRDMQIKVLSCNDEPPKLEKIEDTCVVAGTKIEKNVQAVDTSGGPEDISLTATGEPFFLSNSPAIFPSPVNGIDSVMATFEWQTTCSHVRPSEYQALFEARDEADPVELVDFESFFIKVIAPRPQNPTATPSGNTIELKWDEHVCSNASGYKIYRRLGTYGYTPDSCETGVPAYTGYQKIGETNSVNDTTFVDDGDLVHGQKYCYMVTAYFDNGAESIASVEFCTELIKDVPIITHASVGSTDVNNDGIDTVRWAKPTEIDTVNQYPGPYHYEVFRGPGYSGADNFIGTTDTTDTLAYADTTFIDSNVNTVGGPHTYKAILFSGNDTVGPTNEASTPYLSFTPNDEQLLLEWNESVPWTNTQYEVYRYDSISGNFTQIGTTPDQQFLDTGLTNGVEYCYYIKTIGSYSSTGLVDPIINFSQIGCAEPEDRTPPCPPAVSAQPDCRSFYTDLIWPIPPSSCGADVARYRLYRKATPDGEYKLISEQLRSDTSYRYRNESSIAGCYAVRAIDSAGNKSGVGDSVCVDNCPLYELPNVFTPNGDGVNDRMVPVRSRYVKKVEMVIRNRWGQVVYKTEDPSIEWDGKHRVSGKPVSEGVYFYHCRVHTIRLSGDKVIELKGQVQVLRGDPQQKP